MNVTIVKMYFASDKQSDCLFGGLVATEELEAGNYESATVCETLQPDHVPRRLYSCNGSLLIVMYWYAPHSIINAALKMSNTKCKAVRINSCEFHKACFLRRPGPCIAFQQKIKNLTNVDLTVHLGTSDMLLSIPASECIVVQVLAEWSLKRTTGFVTVHRQCFWQFSLEPFVSLGSQYWIHITGFFERPKEIRPMKEAECHVIALHPNDFKRDTFLFFGPDKYVLACHFQNMTHICSEWHSNIVAQLFTEENPTHNHIFTSVQLPNMLHLQGKFYQHSKTWVDVIIFHHVEKEQSSPTILFADIIETPATYHTDNKGIVLLKLKKTGETKNMVFATALVQLTAASKSTKQPTNPCKRERIHLRCLWHEILYTNFWESTVRLFSEDSKHISLPGVMHYFRVKINETLLHNYSMAKAWLQWEENALKYTVNPCKFVVGEERRTDCLIVLVHLANESVICYTFVISTTPNNGTHNLIFPPLRERTYSGNIQHIPDKWSWHEAFQFCKDIAENLPQFTSKEDLYIAINIFKFHLDMEAVEAFYIGLYQDNSSQVRHTETKNTEHHICIPISY